MASAARHHAHTLDGYLAIERSSTIKHEFVDGEVFAMAAGSPRHDWLESQIARALMRRLGDGPCAWFTSNRQIAVDDGLYSYADGSVFCGEMAYGRDQAAANPVVLVEVLSDSTREYDRGLKLRRYLGIASLRHVLLVEQDRVDVELWSRGPEGWSRAVFTEPDAHLPLPAIGVELPLSEIYAGMERYPARRELP